MSTIFPIVGIGASAGGLEAFEAFFKAMPAQTGMAFVLVQHLQPTTKSILDELIRRFTAMPVSQVIDGIEIEANHVYIIPPDQEMALLHGRLHLFAPQMPRGQRLPIDSFFRSLAVDLHERAIGIILSGNGSDGTLGARAIAGEGGLVMVQEPQSAQYDGMPRSAINSDVITFVLPPAQMPAKLLEYVQQAIPPMPTPVTQAAVSNATSDQMQKLFILLRSQTGHDFSYYKSKTIQRRVERRMIINQIPQLADYVRYLQHNVLEVETLFRDLLIGVTHFFRDPEAFDLIRHSVAPKLLTKRQADQPIRIWIPGCSTGEEAYSLAILFSEQLDLKDHLLKVQIFATDIDDHAIDKARTGIYPDGISADVSPERLQRFFTQENGAFVIKKQIRDMVVFAVQNVVEDPPFSKVDLISCRNLMIYLDSDIQKKVIPIFHYSLNTEGFLFLGNSETVGDFTDLFSVIDRKWKLFQRKGVAAKSRLAASFSTPSLRFGQHTTLASIANNNSAKPTFREIIEQEILSRHSPASILINEQCDILYIHGRTGQYLEPAAGDATVNILKMARPGLRMELTTVIRKVLASQAAVSVNGVSIGDSNNKHLVNITVKPVSEPMALSQMLIVVFEDVAANPMLDLERNLDRSEVASLANKDEQIMRLERELRAKDEYLQTTIEELETANEELKSTNEELQSANEELQSTNEEMETTKEELQSVNEELLTVNTELQQKIEESSRINGDLSNLLAGTQIGTIFVDFETHIRRFTPSVTQLIPLIQSDIGRPINDIVTNLKYSTLIQDIQQVLDSLVSQEKAVETMDGRWYLLRISPYRTLTNVIEGAVITFVNISEQKKVEHALRQFTQVVEQSPMLTIITSTTGSIQYINPQVTTITGYRLAEAVGEPIGDWLVASSQAEWYRVLPQIIQNGHWHGEWQCKHKHGTNYWANVSLAPLRDIAQEISSILITLQVITDHKGQNT